MISMTGYGVSRIKWKGYLIETEVQSLNSRFLEVNVRSPRELLGKERDIRSCVDRHVRRGKINVFINVEREDPLRAFSGINKNNLVRQLKYWHGLQKLLKLNNGLSMRDILAYPDYFGLRPGKLDAGILWPGVKKSLDKALRKMGMERRAEGEHHRKDIAELLGDIEAHMHQIDRRQGQMLGELQSRLRIRIKEWLADTALDSDRLYKEAAFLIEKSDIREELTRLKSHVSQIRKHLKGQDEAGKSMDFVAQELHRETNTIGSKSNDSVIAQNVVAIKSSIEKIREQVLNVE